MAEQNKYIDELPLWIHIVQNVMHPFVSATLVHSTSWPSRAPTGINLKYRCLPIYKIKKNHYILKLIYICLINCSLILKNYISGALWEAADKMLLYPIIYKNNFWHFQLNIWIITDKSTDFEKKSCPQHFWFWWY